MMLMRHKVDDRSLQYLINSLLYFDGYFSENGKPQISFFLVADLAYSHLIIKLLLATEVIPNDFRQFGVINGSLGFTIVCLSSRVS